MRERHRHRADRDERRAEREDEAEQGEDDEVARHHVGEETDGEGEGLREQAEDLDRDHDEPERPERFGTPPVRCAEVAAEAHRRGSPPTA